MWITFVNKNIIQINLGWNGLTVILSQRGLLSLVALIDNSWPVSLRKLRCTGVFFFPRHHFHFLTFGQKSTTTSFSFFVSTLFLFFPTYRRRLQLIYLLQIYKSIYYHKLAAEKSLSKYSCICVNVCLWTVFTSFTVRFVYKYVYCWTSFYLL